MRILSLQAAILCAFLSFPALAHEPTIHPEYPFAYATSPQQKNGAVYVTLRNMSRQPDTLTGASSPIAAKAELHTTVIKENAEMNMDIASMKKVESFYFPEMSSLYFEPFGRHIMLMGLKKQLVAGETVPLTLTFKTAGNVKMEALIVDNSYEVDVEGGQHWFPKDEPHEHDENGEHLHGHGHAHGHDHGDHEHDHDHEESHDHHDHGAEGHSH